MNEHWLLYTSDREHGGTFILGIFNSSDEAWEHYQKIHDQDDRYWRIPSVQQWDNENYIIPHVHSYEKVNDYCECEVCTGCAHRRGDCWCGGKENT